MAVLLFVFISFMLVKSIWVMCATSGHGSFDTERKEIIHRANYLTLKVATSPQKLLDEMPSGIGEQFQGEWALYSSSMTCAALANIAILYPQNKELSIKFIGQIIDIAMSAEIREYDKLRWGEDPMDGIYGNLSHISYYSHLAWLISRYKLIGGNGKYPGESIYIPDMLVAIVALNNYASQYNGEYSSTVKLWIERAKKEWIDQEIGLLASFLVDNGSSAEIEPPVKGSYSALNCYYLSLIDSEFAKEQYECLKKNFKRTFPFNGISEYHDRSCWLGLDIDAGPIIFNLSLGDMEFRSQLLKTAEIAGSTIRWFDKSHYLLANVALVGEAIALAMRTSATQTKM